MEAGMTQGAGGGGGLKMIQFEILWKLFCERDNIAEVESVTVHVQLHTISDTSGIHRGGQMCERTKNGQNDLCNLAG